MFALILGGEVVFLGGFARGEFYEVEIMGVLFLIQLLVSELSF